MWTSSSWPCYSSCLRSATGTPSPCSKPIQFCFGTGAQALGGCPSSNRSRFAVKTRPARLSIPVLSGFSSPLPLFALPGPSTVNMPGFRFTQTLCSVCCNPFHGVVAFFVLCADIMRSSYVRKLLHQVKMVSLIRALLAFSLQASHFLQ